VGVDAINLTILGDDKIVEVTELGGIEIGYGRTLRVENLKIPSGIDVLKFVVDYEKMVRELNEENNVAEMRVESQ